MIEISVQNLIEHYHDGDEIGWAAELEFLWTEHRQQLLELMDSVLAEGFREPVLIGNDRRIWDGHHRIAVALALNIKIPVEHTSVTETVDDDEYALRNAAG